MGHWGLLEGVGAILGCQGGVQDARDVLGAGRHSRYSGARKGIGVSGVPMGCRGPFGASGGVKGVLGGWQEL